MNNFSGFKSLVVIVTTAFLMLSCDKDFNEVGSDIIGDNNFLYDLYDQATVTAYNQKTGVVQTNNQLINSLGIYNNPNFGITKANFVTQAQLAFTNPIFDSRLRISVDSVALLVPYFARITDTDENGLSTYKLDSVYGSQSIDLKIYENGYKLNDLSPSDNFTTAQKYYSDQYAEFENNKKGVGPDFLPSFTGNPLNSSEIPSESTSFIFSNKPIKYKKRDNLLQEIDDEYDSIVAPKMRIALKKEYFEKKIFEAPSGVLFNNNVFKDYFRGLYFKVEDSNEGSLAQLNFSRGSIVMYYTEYEALDDDGNPRKFDHDNDPDTPEVEKKIIRRLIINLKGNTVNLLYNTNTNPDYENAISNPDIDNGDSRLYVKGGVGSMALIDLFKDDELQKLRDEKWMINEANLVFYIDKEKMTGSVEPQRLYLYDATNKKQLQDYTLDQTTFSNAKYNKYIHDGILKREETENGRGYKYRIRITNHIRNLVRKDSTNIRLGLVVTENIGSIDNAKLKLDANGPFPPGEVPFTLDRVPKASVMSPLGTILYGSNIPVNNEDYDKRLKLEIYYTKPN